MMKQDKRQVKIEFRMMIDDQGEKEYNTVKATGYFYNRNNLDVLMYSEELEEGIVVKNLITIHDNKVTIKRTGAITMNQQFNINRKTESLYQHQHGNIHMETYTTSMRYESLRNAEKGELSIVYAVKLNGLDDRNHKLTLTYWEED